MGYLIGAELYSAAGVQRFLEQKAESYTHVYSQLNAYTSELQTVSYRTQSVTL